MPELNLLPGIVTNPFDLDPYNKILFRVGVRGTPLAFMWILKSRGAQSSFTLPSTKTAID
jgi:hypothetical protein